MNQGPKLFCPIRGQLKISSKAKDQLTATEEKLRIDCIRFLLSKKYPKDNFKIETTLLRFGSKGKNSFRTDLVVLDCPAKELGAASIDEVKDHILLIAEIKRDNADAAEAKAMQVKPAMAFIPDSRALGVYWDDVEQRVFYFVEEGKKRRVHDSPINKLPEWGTEFGSVLLSYGDLEPAKNLRKVFEQLEDGFHTRVVDKSKRFTVLLQLLLAKLYDEQTHQGSSGTLEFQDFSVSPIKDISIKDKLDAVLSKASKFYGKYLPEPVPESFKVDGAALRQATKLLAPISILTSRRDVMQEFYMYFAKGLYKWELAQYFTPTEVVDCVVDVVNPRKGEHTKDPACGSADFLISVFRWAADHNWSAIDSIWGSDNSHQAVQVSVLNMVLNGDGKSNIKLEDSLEMVSKHENQFDILLCNPPFGTKIKETRPEVLDHFDLGHEWVKGQSGWERTDNLLDSQETGILFAELCVRQVAKKGRVGIVLPNGYLGNRSPRYTVFRSWLLRQARIVSILSLPRFTFKKSGADVSASLVFVEKREKPLRSPDGTQPYEFHVGMVTTVGWSVGDKRAERLYARDPETGELVLDENNEPIPDADFDVVLGDLYRSAATNHFQWLLKDREAPPGEPGWSVSIAGVLADQNLLLDPKRLCRKFVEVKKEIESKPHFAFRDVVDIIPESNLKHSPAARYRYVEIGNIMEGIYTPVEVRGWQLPSRARHTAKPGDIFAGKIWGSVGKWFMAGGNTEDLIVTNGCYRLRPKEGKEDLLPDLIAGLCSEAYRVQMRGLATGSDGLAEIGETDLLSVTLPKLQTAEARRVALEYLDLFANRESTLKNVVNDWEKGGKEAFPTIAERKTVFVQV